MEIWQKLSKPGTWKSLMIFLSLKALSNFAIFDDVQEKSAWRGKSNKEIEENTEDSKNHCNYLKSNYMNEDNY